MYVKIIVTVILEIQKDNIQETPTLNNIPNSEENILVISNNNVKIARRFSAHYALFQVFFHILYKLNKYYYGNEKNEYYIFSV